MDKPYLIAHKVRGEAAFDVAIRQRCAICDPIRQGLDDGSGPFGCDECEGEGYWWIIGTSGHRAYPYWTQPLSGLQEMHADPVCILEWIPEMPSDIPDHYTINVTKSAPGAGKGLLSLLGLGRKAQLIKRRI